MIEEAGIKITIAILDYWASRPNTYALTLRNSRRCSTMTAISTGCGMIEVVSIDGTAVSMALQNSLGKSLPSAPRCTALGGLSVTKTSKEIEERLKNR